jgi:hypothetical protein
MFMSEIARLQVDILQQQLEELEKLQKLGGLRSKRELWDTAFTLLKWATKKKAQGFSVGSMNADGVYTELEMPFLEHYAVSVNNEQADDEAKADVAASVSGSRTRNIRLAQKRRTA